MSLIKKFDELPTHERVDEITAAVSHKEVKEVIHDIKSELMKNKEIVSLCAPQIGKTLRLFVVRTAKDGYKEFLNPMIVTSKGLHLSRETNESFPEKTFIVPRANELHLAYQTHDGHIQSESYKGVWAEVVQQMVEMLDGVYLTDYALDLDDVGGVKEFDKATQKDKVAVMEMYLNHLKSISKELEEEIDNNPELKNISENIKLGAKYLNGEIIPLDEEGNEVNKEYLKKKAAEKETKVS